MPNVLAMTGGGMCSGLGTAGCYSSERRRGDGCSWYDPSMPRSIAVARMIMLIVSASYLLSAIILAVIRSRGEVVPGWVIAGWAITGALGVGLSLALAPGRPIVWLALLIVTAP